MKINWMNLAITFPDRYFIWEHSFSFELWIILWSILRNSMILFICFTFLFLFFMIHFYPLTLRYECKISRFDWFRLFVDCVTRFRCWYICLGREMNTKRWEWTASKMMEVPWNCLFWNDQELALIALCLFISFVALWPLYRIRSSLSMQKCKFISSKCVCVCENENFVECCAVWLFWLVLPKVWNTKHSMPLLLSVTEFFFFPLIFNHSLSVNFPSFSCPKNDVCLHGFWIADVLEE